MHNSNIGEGGDSNVRFADGNEGLDVREKAHLFGHNRGGRLPGCPPDVRGLSRDERGFDGSLPLLGGPGGDEAEADSNVGVVARNNKREPHTTRRRHGKTKGSAPRFHGQGKAGIEGDGEVRRSNKNSRVGSIF